MWRITGVKRASPTWFAPNYFTKSSRAGWVRLFNERRAVGGESRWPREVWRDGSIVKGTDCKYSHRFKSVSQRLFKLVGTINIVAAANVLHRGHTYITCKEYVSSFFLGLWKRGFSGCVRERYCHTVSYPLKLEENTRTRLWTCTHTCTPHSRAGTHGHERFPDNQ